VKTGRRWKRLPVYVSEGAIPLPHYKCIVVGSPPVINRGLCYVSGYPSLRVGA
jgi:hypothetical protein